MPVQLLADSAYCGNGQEAIELVGDVGLSEVGIRDDGLDQAMPPTALAGPPDFVQCLTRGDVRLHVDGGDNSVLCRVVGVLFDQVVAADALVLAEDPRDHGPCQPRCAIPQPDVVVRINNPGGHGMDP